MESIKISNPKGGVRKDKDPEDIADDELADAENMILRDGNFTTRPGFTNFLNDLNERPSAYIEFAASSSIKVVQGTNRGWWALGASAWTDLAGGVALTGTPTDQVVFRTFVRGGSAWLLGTNGADVPKKWDAIGASYANIGGSPPKARCACVLFDRYVLGNLLTGADASPVNITVSANKDFDTGWGTEQVIALGDTDGPLISMVELSQFQGAMVKSDALYLLIAQGDTAPFRAMLTKTGISGPGAPLLATKLSEGVCAWFAKDGLGSLFDGSSISPLPYAVQKAIADSMNPERMNRGWCSYDSTLRELWVVYPLLGSDEPNGGVIINMDSKNVYPIRFNGIKPTAGGKLRTATGISIGELNVPIGSITQTIGDLGSNTGLRHFVIGESGGRSLIDTGTQDMGLPIPFFWDSAVRGEAERFLTTTRQRHRFKRTMAAQLVSYQVGQRNEGDAISYRPAKSFDISSTRRKVTGHRFSAEYLATRYSGNATQPVTFQGATAYLVKRGRR